MMAHEFESKILKLSSERREALRNGEELLREKRRQLGVERYYDLDEIESPSVRRNAREVLEEYQKLLIVEKNFYSEFHRTFLDDVFKLTDELSPDEKERVLKRSLAGLNDNNNTRIEINAIKQRQNRAILRLIKIFEDNNVNPSIEAVQLSTDEEVNEVELIFASLDTMSDELHKLSMQQKKRENEGQWFIAKFLRMLTGNA